MLKHTKYSSRYKAKIAIRRDDKSHNQTPISKFVVPQSDIMELLKQSKLKRCKDSMKCDQNTK